MKYLLAAAAVTTLFTAAPAFATLPSIDAARSLSNIGQCVAVEGIATVRRDPQRLGTIVDIDGPKSSFLGFIPLGNERQLPQLASLDGQKVRITGVPHIYLARGEVWITDPAQIVLADSVTVTGGSTRLGPEYMRRGTPNAACG
jgi:hypothetical protein